MKRPGLYQLILYTCLAGFLLPNLFTHGIFGDGLIYAVVSRNLAASQGSWWQLFYSEQLFNPFVEHPPLMFWLESCWFRLLGDHHWTEKSFSLLLGIVMVFSLRHFWQKLADVHQWKESWWFPVLLWILVPTIHWAYPNNMLENLLVLFTSWAIWLGYQSNGLKSAFGLGWLVFFAFMTKGVVGLFPLAVYGIRQLVFKNIGWSKTISWSFFALAGFFLPFALSLLISAARENWQLYFEVQLFATLQGERAVQDHIVGLSRFYLIGRLFTELFNPLLISGLLLLAAKAWRQTYHFHADTKRHSYFFLLVALSATLPLLISPKQHSFYLIPAIPWFVFALGLYVAPLIRKRLDSWPQNHWAYKITYGVFMLLFVTAFVLTILRAERYSRDEILLREIPRLATELDFAEGVSISQPLLRHHSLHGYLQRYHKLNLNMEDTTAAYWITEKDSLAPFGYTLPKLQLTNYTIWAKAEN